MSNPSEETLKDKEKLTKGLKRFSPTQLNIYLKQMFWMNCMMSRWMNSFTYPQSFPSTTWWPTVMGVMENTVQCSSFDMSNLSDEQLLTNHINVCVNKDLFKVSDFLQLNSTITWSRCFEWTPYCRNGWIPQHIFSPFLVSPDETRSWAWLD